jgi:uncharacterized protein (DUF1697 family)
MKRLRNDDNQDDTMASFAAFVRGINVGGKNIVKMGTLCDALSERGLGNVKTYVQSGNITFGTSLDIAACEKLVEDVLKDLFHVTAPRVCVYDSTTLQRIIDNTPFDTATPAKLHFGFCKAVERVDWDLSSMTNLFESFDEPTKVTSGTCLIQCTGNGKLTQSNDRWNLC